MPTGYTSPIYEDKPITFAQFVWRCARAFGALLHMRDDGLDRKPTLEAPTWDDYAERELPKVRAKLDDFRALDEGELRAQWEGEHDSLAETWRKSKRGTDACREQDAAMLDQVRAWEPPTKEHQGFKDFMIQQLEEGGRFDSSVWERPERQPFDAWRTEHEACLVRRVENREQDAAKERARRQERTDWLTALDKSVPLPEKMP